MINALPSLLNCTGCAACHDICPHQCIEMRRDEEGFLHPHVQEAKCVGCGLCVQACPVCTLPDVQEQKTPPRAFCLLHKNWSTWNASSSGDAFSAICEAYGDKDTIFYGAAFTNGLNVKHIRVEGYANISPLRKSKYVQSETGGIYQSLKSDLLDGKRVLFSGTPCQVAAASNYLHISHIPSDNLLLVDIVCHGVGSPAVFQSFLDALGKRMGSQVTGYSFRVKKRYGFNLDTYYSDVTLADATHRTLHRDAYYRAFVLKRICRSSCYHCRFAARQRYGDITIADFKRVFQAFPEKAAAYNYSSVMLNTRKGEAIFPQLAESCTIEACDPEFLYKNNPPLDHCSGDLEKRNRFFEAFVADNTDIQKLLTKQSGNEELLMTLWKLLPVKLAAKIKKLKSRIFT